MSTLKTIGSICCLMFFFIFCFECDAGNNEKPIDSDNHSYVIERKRMVERQIIARGIRDQKIIDAFLKVERHQFVPEKYVRYAYEDRPLPIGEGQTISQPYIVAYMTYLLDLSKTDKVLEIGTGSGYQAAILGELSNSVFTIEIFASLGEKAKHLLKKLGYGNIQLKIGDGYKGWKEHAPYDAIIVTCSPTHVPEPLVEQLKENGKLMIPVGETGDQKLYLFQKIGNELKVENVLPVLFVPMIDKTGKKY